VHDSFQDEALRVDQEVALAPADLFGTIIATCGPPFSVVFTDWLSRPIGLVEASLLEGP
jgi:hypothetical protein